MYTLSLSPLKTRRVLKATTTATEKKDCTNNNKKQETESDNVQEDTTYNNNKKATNLTTRTTTINEQDLDMRIVAGTAGMPAEPILHKVRTKLVGVYT